MIRSRPASLGPGTIELREAETGVKFTITMRGRPVTTLGPAASDGRRVNVPAEAVRTKLAETPPVDAGFAADVARL